MYHYVEKIEDVKGNALPGYFVGLRVPDSSSSTSGVEQPIYADDSGTAIIASSGVANKAMVDQDGMVSIYVPANTYHLDIYAPDSTTLIKSILNIPMLSGEAGAAASVTVGTVTTLAAGSSATVTNSGTVQNAVLDFGIPKGDTGSGTSFAWGAATGTLSDQTDLQNALNLKANLASPSFTGTPVAPTATAGTNTTQIATTAFVLANASNLNSPAFTGTPTAPTAAVNTNTTQLATTAFVVGQAAAVNPLMNGSVAIGTSLKYARADHVHPTDTSRAPLASPGFTGTPTAPTAAFGTNSTQLATTAFVQASFAGWAGATSITTLGTISTGTWNGTTIAVGSGGTGLATIPTNGKLLIGNGAGYTLANLTAGSGITVTNGAGTITIAATAGSMVYPGAGIAVSTGSAWTTSKTAPSGTIVGTTDTQTLSNKTLDANCAISDTGTIAAASPGTRGVVQNAQTAAYQLALTDAGKHISITTGGITIPANSGTAFPIGTAISIFNNSSSTQTIAITTDTLRQAGTTNTGSRTLAAYGVATLLKVASTTWVVAGSVS